MHDKKFNVREDVAGDGRRGWVDEGRRRWPWVEVGARGVNRRGFDGAAEKEEAKEVEEEEEKREGGWGRKCPGIVMTRYETRAVQFLSSSALSFLSPRVSAVFLFFHRSISP